MIPAVMFRAAGPRALRTLALAVTAGAVAVMATACSASPPLAPSPNVGLVHVNVSRYQGGLVTPPKAKPAIVLTDTAGHRYDLLADTKGEVTLLFFGYTHCPGECPLTMSKTGAALRLLTPAQQARVRVVFATVDPARDTGPVLRRWLDQFSPAFIGLTGTLRQVRAAAGLAGIPVENPATDGAPGTVDHGTEMLAFSADNRAYLAFFPSTPATSMARDLRLLVAGHHP
jgi:protein SCO1